MARANIQFPLFDLRTPKGTVLLLHRHPESSLLPLFYSHQDAALFASRHSADCVPSSPMSPKLLYELITSSAGIDPREQFDIIFDPVELVIENLRIFRRDVLIKLLERMRDKRP